MDFDHVRGKKLANVGDMLRVNHSRRKVWNEIAKCDLVCSNCHRSRTHHRRVQKRHRQHRPSRDAE